MKMIRYLISVFILFFTISIQAQNNKTADSTVSFKVFGACGQCEERIETTLKIKGIKKADWDVDSKMLQLVFNPSVISLEKIKNKIVAAGHDLEDRKAKDDVYNKLPACCHYRELINDQQQEAKTEIIPVQNTVTPGINPEKTVKGVVLEEDQKGSFKALKGASVYWLNSNAGTITDSAGVFRIKHTEGSSRLVVSYAGYTADTLTVADMSELKIILAKGKQLKEVVINSRQRSTYVSALNPIRTQVMTEKELFKAACCNLSESFETNPSVDVSYNDAITGSKQIQLLGLSGNYTQLTVENLPGPRGIATPLGLNSIAGPWVESIQLTKGIGSVANGFESIAGQINVELKKPERSEKLYANVYVNDMGKTDLNLNLSQKIGKKWSTALLLHDDFISNKVDFNKDGFRDLPTGNLFSMINRWKFEDGKGWMSQFGFKLLYDQRTGGEVNFIPSADKLTTNHYGLGINTERQEVFMKTGYVFPEKKYKSFGLQLSAFNHQQDSYFGLISYNARQQNLYGNFIYQSIIGNTAHKFRTGISFVYDKYNENFRNNTYKRNETVPGAFFEYTYDYLDKLSIVAGIRTDHNNLYGWFLTPRLHLRYEPFSGTVIRVSAGRGQRTANIFAENMSVLASSRQLNILSVSNGKAYGLDQEIAWNKGISIDQKFKLFSRDASLAVDYFRNDFSNQVVADLEDPQEVKFYNLAGKSYSNSFQAELNLQPVNKLELRLAYRLFDVKTSYSGQLLQKPLTSKHRAFANLAYEVKGWKFDYTINFNSKKRIPYTGSNPAAYRREEYSPAYFLMNAQVSKTLGRKKAVDIYIGGENLANYFQEDAIIAANAPFSNYFDASLVWGPVTGRQLYAGIRYKIK